MDAAPAAAAAGPGRDGARHGARVAFEGESLEVLVFRVHQRSVHAIARVFSSRACRVIELVSLLNALAFLTLLILMHTEFVNQPGCLGDILPAKLGSSDVVRLEIESVWSDVLKRLKADRLRAAEFRAQLQRVQEPRASAAAAAAESGTTRTDHAGTDARQGYGDGGDARQGYGDGGDGGDAASGSVASVGDSTSTNHDDGDVAAEPEAALWSALGNATSLASDDTSPAGEDDVIKTATTATTPEQGAVLSDQALEDARVALLNELGLSPRDMAELDDVSSTELEQFLLEMLQPVYEFSYYRGLLLLPNNIRGDLGVNVTRIVLPLDHQCLNQGWLRVLLENTVGFDVIVLNGFLASFKQGYLVNAWTRDWWNLEYVDSMLRDNLHGSLVFKFGVLLTATMLYAATRSLVSMSLREAQARVYEWSLLARRRIFPVNALLVRSFMLGMVLLGGLLFFFGAFFEDPTYALLLLVVVWMSELFSIVCVRTRISVVYFPRFVFLFFLFFYLYHFFFINGFGYIAFATAALFIQHTALVFFVRFELPAVLSGRISLHRMREGRDPLAFNVEAVRRVVRVRRGPPARPNAPGFVPLGQAHGLAGPAAT